MAPCSVGDRALWPGPGVAGFGLIQLPSSLRKRGWGVPWCCPSAPSPSSVGWEFQGWQGPGGQGSVPLCSVTGKGERGLASLPRVGGAVHTEARMLLMGRGAALRALGWPGRVRPSAE